MTLIVHRAARADLLVNGLAGVLADPLPDVFADEVVAVPSRGVERWLMQRLSHSLGRSGEGEAGVCAGMRFPSLSHLLGEILDVPDPDPWAAESLAWAVLAAVDDSLGQAWCADLNHHLGHGAPAGEERPGRRYQVARRLAGLFSAYATFRPELVRDWRDGGDSDGAGGGLPPDLAWQPRLWREVAARIPGLDPVARFETSLLALRADPSATDLPSRINVFGITRLSRADRDALLALADHRDVHLWLPHPSARLWEAVSTLTVPPVNRRRRDRSGPAAIHPLLRSLGRESRELAVTLSGYASSAVEINGPAPRTLLHRLQRDITENRLPERGLLDPDDCSIRVHACHGASRQVDALRDIVMGLLADDPTLEPRDIVVMCPDIERYAPLISASFGLGDAAESAHPAHALSVRLADRSLRQTNPLVETAARLLDLADARVTASEVLDLAGTEPVRRRFGFDDDSLSVLADWIGAAGVRWGLDQEGREPFGLGSFPQNTWAVGLDRLLLGVAMAEEPGLWLGRALPLDDVGSTQVVLAGRFAEFLQRLRDTLADLRGSQPVARWTERLLNGVRALAAAPPLETWQSAELHRQLTSAREEAGPLVESTALGLADVRALFADRLSGRPTRANFRTGSLTVCTMVPMRSVPHRVVCLIGLDDGSFPRSIGVDGDDVLARDPLVGERDPRAEDRQLMLDAIMAATDTLVITYSGADERTGRPRPPAVPLAELLDTLDATAFLPAAELPGASSEDRLATARVVVRQPLQPFDDRLLTPGRLGMPFTFDQPALAGARAAGASRVAVPGLLDLGPLPAVDRDLIDLELMVRLLTKPASGFLWQRLGIRVFEEDDDPVDDLTIAVDGLQRWQIGDRLLGARLAGADVAAVRQAEWRRGALPPGPLGNRLLNEVMDDVETVMKVAEPLWALPATTVDVTISAPGGREVRGSISGVRGDRLLTVQYGKVQPVGRLRSWLRLLALTIAHPERSWTASTLGRQDGAVRASELGPVPVDAARAYLDELVELYLAGLRRPLPVGVKTGEAYARARLGSAGMPGAVRQGRAMWEGKFGENLAADNARVWGSAAPFDDLLLVAAPTDGSAPDPAQALKSALGGWLDDLVRVLWKPLLDHERMVWL